MLPMSMSEMDTYKDQTVAVECLLGYHPEFDPANDSSFDERECQAFRMVFQPDWDRYDNDYREAYRRLKAESPELFDLAQRVLKRFFRAHGVNPKGLEL